MINFFLSNIAYLNSVHRSLICVDKKIDEIFFIIRNVLLLITNSGKSNAKRLFLLIHFYFYRLFCKATEMEVL